MKTITLSQIDHETLLDTFEEAFGGYAVKFDRREINAMLVRRGYNPTLSFGITDPAGRLVAFILNGTGDYDGRPTCYDCGTGTLPDYRGQGLAGALFAHACPLLRAAGIEQYLLEVLCDNTAAISVYRRSGLETTATYHCFRQDTAALVTDRPARLPLSIRPIDPSLLHNLTGFVDFTPSWQNSLQSILRGRDGLIIRAAFSGDTPVGYCVSDPLTGDIAQIAVDPAERRQGIATALLDDARQHSRSRTMKVLNIEAGCQSMHHFMHAVNFAPALSQYAMRRRPL